LKQWVWGHVGWISWFWLKRWNWWLSCKFIESHITQMMGLLQDTEPMDSLPNHPKSCIGCIKWIWNRDSFEAMVWRTCWLDILILAQKVGLAELNFRHLTPPK
jgi:hypothetical protein